MPSSLRLLCTAGFVGLVACSSHSRTSADAATPDDSATDGAPGGICGGLAPRPCAANEYCDYADNDCGIGDRTGTCKPRPEACPAVVIPSCACDGKVYTNDCLAYVAGFDLSAHGTCVPPRGDFNCGYRVCDLGTQYCKHEIKPPDPDSFSCVPLPTACRTTPSCACLAGEPCGASCDGDAIVGLTLSCP
jgi:hypothetical protein